MTVTTRNLYVMARDAALPGSTWINNLNLQTKIPDRAILVVFLLEASVCLLPLVSSAAFTAITQISTIGY